MPGTTRVREQLERLLDEAEGVTGNPDAESAWASETKRLVDALLGPQLSPPNAHSAGYYEFTFAKSHAERAAILRAILLTSSADDARANAESHSPQPVRPGSRPGSPLSQGEQQAAGLPGPSGREGNPTQYDVFISFKNLLPDGTPTRDSEIAREVYDFLEKKGFSVFLSNVSLERLGISEYKRAIDDALDVASVMVAVGTSREHLEWRWVRYEWDSFFNDILSGFKPSGRVFAFIEGMRILDLPRSLRQAQTFVNEPGALDALFNFISNALEKPPASQSPKPRSEHRPLHAPRTPVVHAEHDIFFVYANADRAYVHELAKELEKHGVSWTENVTMGDPPEVAELLKQSSFVVFIDSGNAKGPALYQELDVARGMAQPIVPLRIAEVRPRASDDPLRFVEAIQYLDGKGTPVSGVANELASMTDRGAKPTTGARRREVVDQLKALLKELRRAFYDAQSGKSFESSEQHLRRWKSRLIRFLDANLSFDEAVSCSAIHSALAAGDNSAHLESSFEGHKGYLEGLIDEIEGDPRFPLTATATASGKSLPSFGSFTYKGP